ncbi:MAG: WbqC family protein, partial [bacterium]
VKINNQVSWQKKQQHTLELNYSKTVFFNRYERLFNELWKQTWITIDKLNICMVKKIAEILGITTRIVCSSELGISSASSQRLVDICKKLKGDTYIAGQGGEQYMDTALFEQEGIGLQFQKYNHPVYPQLFGEFVSHLSIIDLLCNCGDRSLEILKGNR